ncbi:MAG: hypothetical protein NXI32_21660 [bacterium]|nr:hypothetical protein [bacterium]
MNNLAKIVSLLTLSLVIVPCLLYFTGTVSLNTVKWTALAGTIGWFIATPLWMSRELPVDANQVEI